MLYGNKIFTLKRKLILFFVVAAIGTYCFSITGQPAFSSDGCTLFPDKLFKYNWGECCEIHDNEYWLGGTSEMRTQSDEALRQCVNEVVPGTFVGNTMHNTVRITGSHYLPTFWRWGFRQNYLH